MTSGCWVRFQNARFLEVLGIWILLPGMPLTGGTAVAVDEL